MTFAILVRESCTCKFKPAASRPMYSASTTLWLRHSELGHGVGQRAERQVVPGGAGWPRSRSGPLVGCFERGRYEPSELNTDEGES